MILSEIEGNNKNIFWLLTKSYSIQVRPSLQILFVKAAFTGTCTVLVFVVYCWRSLLDPFFIGVNFLVNCTMMQFKIQGLCSSFDCFVIYNSEGEEMLFFYLHLHKIPPIIIARFYSCLSGLRKPRPFFSFSCSVFKIRIASFNYIIICTITKLWMHEPFRNDCI